MALTDREAYFHTPMDNFYYTIMPFGLKIGGLIYERAIIVVFYDMLCKEVEDYVL